MAETKLIKLSVIILGLILISGYQKFKINDYQRILKADRDRKMKSDQLRKIADIKKFMKSKEKIFQKNENLKNDILKIFKEFAVSTILFKQISGEEFALKFKISSEENFYILLDKLRSDLCGVIYFENINIKNLEDFLQVAIKCKMFYPSQNLQKYFYVNHIEYGEFPEMFNLKKTDKYQLNGISHYKAAFINGQSYREGDSVGGYKILKIYERHIMVENKKKVKQVNLDETW